MKCYTNIIFHTHSSYQMQYNVKHNVFYDRYIFLLLSWVNIDFSVLGEEVVHYELLTSCTESFHFLLKLHSFLIYFLK